MNKYEYCNYLDGPKTVKWLKSIGAKPWHINKNCNYYHKWSKGRSVSIYVLDDFLTRWGIGFWEIPDECWMEGNPFYNKRKNYKPKKAANGQFC